MEPRLEQSRAELIEATRQLWAKRSSTDQSTEDARQIVENITGFFDTLYEWDKAAKGPGAPTGDGDGVANP